MLRETGTAVFTFADSRDLADRQGARSWEFGVRRSLRKGEGQASSRYRVPLIVIISGEIVKEPPAS